jgi:hypothetical protein
MTIGCRDPKQILTAVLRHCGHRAGGPTAVVHQSMALARSPISPPPARTERSLVRFMKRAGKRLRRISHRSRRTNPATRQSRGSFHTSASSDAFFGVLRYRCCIAAKCCGQCRCWAMKGPQRHFAAGEWSRSHLCRGHWLDFFSCGAPEAPKLEAIEDKINLAG